MRQEVDTQYREASLDVRGNNNDRYSAALSAQLQNSIGHTGATLAHYQQRGGNEMAYSATHSSGLALGRRGFYWGGGLAPRPAWPYRWMTPTTWN